MNKGKGKTKSTKKTSAKSKKTTSSKKLSPKQPVQTNQTFILFKNLGSRKISFKLGTLVLVGELIILTALLLGVWLLPNAYQSPLTQPSSLEVSRKLTLISQKVSSISAQVKPAATTSAIKTTYIAPLNSGRSVNVPILMYHYIGNNPNPADKARYILETTPDMLDAELNYLSQSGYTPISLDTLYAALEGQATLPSKPIVLSFDDGYVDFFVNAFPILEKYHFHAVSFIPTSLMNQGYYMTWAEIKQIQQSGLVSFEAHSLTHPDLTAISPEKAQQEIAESKKILESETGAPVNFFAYPYGTSNSLIQQYVRQAGYAAAVGTWYGRTEAEGDIFNWPRVRINGEITLQQFESQLSS